MLLNPKDLECAVIKDQNGHTVELLTPPNREQRIGEKNTKN